MPEEETSGVRRWLVDIARWRPSPAQFDAAAALLPPHDRPAIYRFVKQDDRKRALVSRLLQYSLGRHVLLIPFRQINICRTPEGKLYLVPLHTLWPIIIPTIIHHRSLQLHPISSEPFCLSAWSVAFSH
ncbi:hypothetical protein PVAP13_8KG031808 [Panicum virgatum]|uniref:holo-[acyl-carrier-protein] synthase n=1 Tax=Panicum virgatum TaxID=38727 RepID=A0A8T0PG49_PANVG|nr:hypothetical protein PVAP13_8KG031808 [Panicum virgatum]